jgi:virulence factor Mce-like protein
MKKILSALLSIAIVAGCVYAYIETRPEAEFYTVSADVEQAPNLFAGGRVMVRGVEVGEISDVTPRPGGVRVTMEIDDGTKIPADAQLAIVPITVISDRYVQFSPAYEGGELLEDGDHLSAASTSIPAELDDVLAQLKELLETIEPKKGEERGPLAKLVNDVDYVLRGKVEDVRGSLTNSASFLENLAISSSDLTELIRNLDELFITLASRRSEIGLVNERFRLVAEALQKDQEHLEATIENITLLSTEAQKFFEATGDDLGEALDTTNNVIGGILEHQDALAEGFRWTNVIAEALGATDASGKGLFAYTGKQAAPGAPGSEYNYRLDTRDTVACERIDTLAKSLLGGGFGNDPAVIFGAILAFTPVEYHEDLSYLIRQIMPVCTGIEFDTTPLRARALKAVSRAVKKVGPERFRAAVGVWLLETIANDELPKRVSKKDAKKVKGAQAKKPIRGKKQTTTNKAATNKKGGDR